MFGAYRFILVLFLSAPIFWGCQKRTTNLYAQPISTCKDQTNFKSFLIEYQTGHVERITAQSESDFLENILPQIQNKIAIAEPNYKFRLEHGDAETSRRELMNETWPLDIIGADNYWAQGFYGQGVLVAVVDSGVDISHTQLTSQIWTHPEELAGNDFDDDGNGWIDDTVGWDFQNDVPYSEDSLGHGTHIAGIIAAQKQDAVPFQGVAPQAKILPLRFLGGQGGYLSDALQAIQYASALASKFNYPLVVNASWSGTYCSEILGRLLQKLETQRLLFVAAAGNSGIRIEDAPEFPAAFNLPHQITVAALGPDLNLAPFSNWSSKVVHLAAPGVDILSTFPGNESRYMSGTSMAAPFVSAAAALIWSARPELSATEVRETILRSVQKGTYPVLSSGYLSFDSLF